MSISYLNDREIDINVASVTAETVTGAAVNATNATVTTLLTVGAISVTELGADSISDAAGSAEPNFPFGLTLNNGAILDTFETTSFSASYTGAVVAGPFTFQLQKINNVVTLHIPDSGTVTGVATNLIGVSSAIPVGFRPAESESFAVALVNNGAYASGFFLMGSGGGFQFELLGGGNWAVANARVPATTVCWYV